MPGWSIRFTNLRELNNPFYVPPELRGYPHIDVIYWDNNRFPWDKRRVKLGTSFVLTEGQITVKSHEHSSFKDQLSQQAADDLLRLLTERWDELRRHSRPADQPAYLSFEASLDNDRLDLNIREPDVLSVWKEICRIIGRQHWRLRNLLLSYEKELADPDPFLP